MKKSLVVLTALALAACNPAANRTDGAPSQTTQAQTGAPPAGGKPDGATAPGAAPTQAAAAKPDGGPAPAAAPAQAADAKPAAPQGAALTPAMLVGRWGDNGDCTKDIIINGDGTFRSYTGGSGTWTLNGDRMSMTGANGTSEVRVTVTGQNTLLIANPDGSFGTSQRC